jgi:hypothetical protein
VYDLLCKESPAFFFLHGCQFTAATAGGGRVCTGQASTAGQAGVAGQAAARETGGVWGRQAGVGPATALQMKGTRGNLNIKTVFKLKGTGSRDRMMKLNKIMMR